MVYSIYNGLGVCWPSANMGSLPYDIIPITQLWKNPFYIFEKVIYSPYQRLWAISTCLSDKVYFFCFSCLGPGIGKVIQMGGETVKHYCKCAITMNVSTLLNYTLQVGFHRKYWANRCIRTSSQLSVSIKRKKLYPHYLFPMCSWQSTRFFFWYNFKRKLNEYNFKGKWHL